MRLKVFIRQSFTEAFVGDKEVVQSVIDMIKDMRIGASSVELLTGDQAYSSDEFKQGFAKYSKSDFTPQNFREYRLTLLKEADAFIVLRTGLSESTAFEISYNIFSGLKVPIFFAVHETSPIKTTLLQDLQDLIDIEYGSFKKPGDIRAAINSFLQRIQSMKRDNTNEKT